MALSPYTANIYIGYGNRDARLPKDPGRAVVDLQFMVYVL